MFAQEEKHKEISYHTSHTESMAFMADKRAYNDSFQPKHTNFRKP